MTSKNIGIIHVDRHADIQETDLDERMHTTPYFHATNIPNVPAKNLVQIGIGGWQVGDQVYLSIQPFLCSVRFGKRVRAQQSQCVCNK